MLPKVPLPAQEVRIAFAILLVVSVVQIPLHKISSIWYKQVFTMILWDRLTVTSIGARLEVK